MDENVFHVPGRLQRTLIGRRNILAEWLRLQVYGVMWAATGIDNDYPSFEPLPDDESPDQSFAGIQPRQFTAKDMAFDVLDAARQMMGDIPILVVNEPIFISRGANSQIRYNSVYPRWAYDQYRMLMAERARVAQWRYLDVWDLIPPEEFTDTPLHITPGANRVLANRIGEAILEFGNSTPQS
jgi:hypothetical protein